MRSRWLCGVLFSGLSVVQAGCAQDMPSETASLAGRAVLLDGQPVEGAKVSVWHEKPDGSLVLLFETYTEVDGRFRIPSVPAGKKLQIAANKRYPGYKMYQAVTFVTLIAGETRDLPELKGGQRPPPIATPENAHLLESQEVPPAQIDRFVQALSTSGYHDLARMGAGIFKHGLHIPDHAERFKAFPSSRLSAGQVRYEFFSKKGEAGAAQIALFVEMDSGRIVKFSNVEASF